MSSPERFPITSEQLIRIARAAYDDGQRDLLATLTEAGVRLPVNASALVNNCKTVSETIDEIRKEITSNV